MPHLIAAFLLCLPALAGAEEEVRVTEQTQTLAEAWAEPGFRLQLRFGYEQLEGVDRAPGSWGIPITVEPGARLSDSLSLTGSIRYGILLGELEGLRWSTTADLVWHVSEQLFAGVGAGYAGLAGNVGLGSCVGEGGLGLVRAGWLIPLGELVSMGPELQADLQLSRCRGSAPASSGRSWLQGGVALQWAFAWR